MKNWSQGDKIALASLIVGLVSCVAAVVVVPEIRRMLGLESLAISSMPTAASQPAALTVVPAQPPTSTEALRPTSMLSCPAVGEPFATVWSLVQKEIGCTDGNAVNGYIAEENFEGGKMFWREQFDHNTQDLVLFNDGTWRIFKHEPYGDVLPEFSCTDVNTPKQCPPTPKYGFGMLWCNMPEVRSGLGNATDCERGYQGSMQQFERGFMLQTDSGAIYVFYNTGRWERR